MSGLFFIAHGQLPYGLVLVIGFFQCGIFAASVIGLYAEQLCVVSQLVQHLCVRVFLHQPASGAISVLLVHSVAAVGTYVDGASPALCFSSCILFFNHVFVGQFCCSLSMLWRSSSSILSSVHSWLVSGTFFIINNSAGCLRWVWLS